MVFLHFFLKMVYFPRKNQKKSHHHRLYDDVRWGMILQRLYFKKIRMHTYFDDDNPWDKPKAPKKDDKVKEFKRPSSKQSDAPSFDELSKKFKDHFGGDGPNHGGPDLPNMKNAFLAAPIIILVLWLVSGFFRVQEGEMGVVLRFGKMESTVGPGLRYHWPYPFESEIVRKVSVVNKIDGNDIRDDENSLILTGDENMVHTNYTVQWKIKDISDYLFTARNPDATIRVAAESVIRQVIGKTKARLALTEGRESIGVEAQKLLQDILDGYKMGIHIINVQLQSVFPPQQVIEAFNDMQASLVDADRLRNEAESYRNDILPRARGEAEKIRQQAEAYKQEHVAKAKGDVLRFNAVYEGYKNNKDVVTKRYYLEALQEVLSKTSKTIIDSNVSQGVMPYLNLQNKQQKTEVQ